jgi:hypothetical protein
MSASFLRLQASSQTSALLGVCRDFMKCILAPYLVSHCLEVQLEVGYSVKSMEQAICRRGKLKGRSIDLSFLVVP